MRAKQNEKEKENRAGELPHLDAKLRAAKLSMGSSGTAVRRGTPSSNNGGGAEARFL